MRDDQQYPRGYSRSSKGTSIPTSSIKNRLFANSPICTSALTKSINHEYYSLIHLDRQPLLVAHSSLELSPIIESTSTLVIYNNVYNFVRLRVWCNSFICKYAHHILYTRKYHFIKSPSTKLYNEISISSCRVTFIKHMCNSIIKSMHLQGYQLTICYLLKAKVLKWTFELNKSLLQLDFTLSSHTFFDTILQHETVEICINRMKLTQSFISSLDFL